MFELEVTDWKPEPDCSSVYTRTVGIKGQPPFLLVRVVLDKDNKWVPVVRCATGRGVLLSEARPCVSIYNAQKQAMLEAKSWLNNFAASFSDSNFGS